MKKILAGFFVSLMLLTACYTVVSHPKVSYTLKYDIAEEDSLIYMQYASMETDVILNDNCLKCHDGFNYSQFHGIDTIRTAMHTKALNPWWTNEYWYAAMAEESGEEPQKRSKRTYVGQSGGSGGSGGADYLPPPGLLMDTDAVSTGSGSLGKTKPSNTLPVRKADDKDGGDKKKNSTKSTKSAGSGKNKRR
jgi:hypothetical protein